MFCYIMESIISKLISSKLISQIEQFDWLISKLISLSSNKNTFWEISYLWNQLTDDSAPSLKKIAIESSRNIQSICCELVKKIADSFVFYIILPFWWICHFQMPKIDGYILHQKNIIFSWMHVVKPALFLTNYANFTNLSALHSTTTHEKNSYRCHSFFWAVH